MSKLTEFREAVNFALDEIETTLSEREENLDLKALSADFKLTFNGTNMEISSCPKID